MRQAPREERPSDDNLTRRSGEPDSAKAPPNARYKACFSEVVNHLHQMVLRDGIGTRHLGNRAQPIRPRSKVKQHPQGIVGVARQLHVASRSQRPIDAELIYASLLHVSKPVIHVA